MDQTQNDRTYRPLSGTVYETIDQEDIGNDASLRGPVYMAEEDDLSDIVSMVFLLIQTHLVMARQT